MAWLTGWTYRKKITVQTAYLDSDLSDFPLYVKINADADLSSAAADGTDIRFTSSDGETLLKYERNSWSGGGGSAVTANIWVKTNLSTGGTDIYLYYNKSGAADGQDAVNVWDSNYEGVWHLNELSGTTAYDSTGNNRDLAHNNTPTLGAADAFGGSGAYSFDQANSESLGPSATFARTNDYCMQCWAKWSDIGYQNGLLNYGGSEYWARHIYCAGNAGVHPLLHHDQSHSGGFYVNLGNPGSNWFFTATSVQRQGANDYDYNCWLNGSHTDGSHAGGDNTLSYAFSVANNVFDPTTWNGSIDEVRYSKAYRSIAWLTFEYHNVSEADNELTFGTQESQTIPINISIFGKRKLSIYRR